MNTQVKYFDICIRGTLPIPSHFPSTPTASKFTPYDWYNHEVHFEVELPEDFNLKKVKEDIRDFYASQNLKAVRIACR